MFATGWSEEAARYAPEAIAGTREQVLTLETRLTHAVIVLARPGEMLLTEDDRDVLWRRFGVPVFEQIIGLDGELLAAECEAHNGLHVMTPQRDWTPYRKETSPCGCGKTTARLFPLAKLAAAS